jgi:cytochrome P450
LGATLARLEGQEALKALAERFPSMYLEMNEDRVEYQPSITFRSIKELPVSWN